MKAIGYKGGRPLNDPEAFVQFELNTPTPSGRDVLVQVRVVGANPVDYKVRQLTTEPQDPPKILGWDAAGEVVSVGEEAELFKPGDQVFYAGDITRPGSNSEYQLVDERIIGRMPETLSFSEAAALPLTSITAWEALFHRLRVPTPPQAQPAKSVLIIGGAGGVGSIAIQLAARVAGLRVVATASRPETKQWCLDLGAHHIIDHSGDMQAQMISLGFEYADYILIFNNTDKNFPPAAEIVAPQGGICTIVENEAPVDLAALKWKSAAFHWELMFTRPMFNTPDMIEQHYLLNEIARLVDSGIIKTTLSQVLNPINVENIRQAHETLEAGHTIGKIVLEGWE